MLAGSVVTINEDNVMVLNGRKVFPIGLSPGPPNNSLTTSGNDSLQEFRNAGALFFRINQTNNWNAALINYQQTALDWAAAHDMYLWLNLRELSQFPITSTNTAASLRNIVDTFRDHPALGVWKNYDEAWWGGVSVSNLLNGYNVIKQEDTNHPVVQTHAPRGYVSDLQPYNVAADVLAVDIYPVAATPPSNPPPTNSNISVVGDWTLELGEVAAGQKQFWLIEQIAFSGTTPPSKTLVYPTFTQSRYMAYQAIIDGTRGLMFFGGNIANTLSNQDVVVGWNWSFWNSTLRRVVRELGDHSLLADALVVSNSALPITITGSSAPDLEYCVREVPPYLYILASKREGTNATVTFSGLPGWAGVGDVLYETNRTVTATAGEFTDTFVPFDVHVYRFAQSNQTVRILYPPQNQTNYPGTVASFFVSADGTGPLAYQWRKNGITVTNGGNASGATTASLVISNVTVADVGNYDVIVSGIGAATSAPVARLVVTNLSPEIVIRPQSITNPVGTVAYFSVSAVGTGTLSYQWRKNGLNLANTGNVSGATTNVLALSGVSPSDVANYEVVVSGFGSTTSAPAASLVVVTQSLLFYEPFAYTNIGGLVSSNNPADWAFNGAGSDDLGVTTGSLSYPGLAAPIGNSATNGGPGLGARRIWDYAVNTGVLYFSALLRVNSLGYPTWNSGSGQIGALTATDNQSFRLAVMIKSNSPTGYVLGLQKGGTGAFTTFATNEFHAGDTLFLAGRYDFTVSPNSIALWINPGSTNFGATNAPATVLTNNGGTDGFTIDRINLRQNTAASVPANVQWDELRSGFTWASVTPPALPSLTSLKHFTNGTFQFTYTNVTALSYSVYASTNLTQWSPIGTASLISNGLYQFADPSASNKPRRFYQLRSP